MILATHILIGTATARTFTASNPIAGFLISWAFHYVGDAIPHWEYTLNSLEEKDGLGLVKRKISKKGIFLDYFRVAIDAILGSLIAYWVISPASTKDLIYFGAIIFGSVFPDFIQYLYFVVKLKFLKPLNDFQYALHTNNKKLKKRPFIGIPFQIAIFLLAIYFAL